MSDAGTASSMPSWVSPLGDVSSMLGLAITVWVLHQTFAIKKSFTFRIRLPESRRRLEELAASLLKGIPNWTTSKVEILADLSRIRAVLLNVSKRLSSFEKESTASLLRKIRLQGNGWYFWQDRNLQTALSVDELWSIYGDLMGLVEMLQQAEQDSRWE